MNPSTSTASDGTPSGRYPRCERTHGYCAKQQREMMIENLRDKVTEMAVKRVYSSMEETKKHILDTMKT